MAGTSVSRYASMANRITSARLRCRRWAATSRRRRSSGESPTLVGVIGSELVMVGTIHNRIEYMQPDRMESSYGATAVQLARRPGQIDL